MEVKIIRSLRGKKTVSGRLVKDTILIHAPYHIHEFQLEKIVSQFKERFQRRKLKEELNRNEELVSVFHRLNEKYFANKLTLTAIEYVANQNTRFGCCNYRTGCIRISHRLSTMPVWVRDYVVMHEMAHLVEPNHRKAFWDIVGRYALTERARGYLMAVGLAQEEDVEDTPTQQ